MFSDEDAKIINSADVALICFTSTGNLYKVSTTRQLLTWVLAWSSFDEELVNCYVRAGIAYPSFKAQTALEWGDVDLKKFPVEVLSSYM